MGNEKDKCGQWSTTIYAANIMAAVSIDINLRKDARQHKFEVACIACCGIIYGPHTGCPEPASQTTEKTRDSKDFIKLGIGVVRTPRSQC
jgi:hypothetical protein